MGKRTFSWPHLEIFTPNTQRGITLELHLLLGTLFPSRISNKLVGMHAFFIRKLVMLLVLDFFKNSVNSSTKTLLRIS